MTKLVKAAGCPICEHVERPFLDQLLRRGRSPRSVARGANGVNRKQLARHRDGDHHLEEAMAIGAKTVEEASHHAG